MGMQERNPGSQAGMPAWVKAEIQARLRVPEPPSVIPVPVTLLYDGTDPYAVRMLFFPGRDDPVEWAFARALLAEGLSGPAGDGDVRVWPRSREELSVQLVSPFGKTLVGMPSREVARFVADSFRLVPDGGESGAAGDELDGLFLPGGDLFGRHA